jgi:hypothetical protein
LMVLVLLVASLSLEIVSLVLVAFLSLLKL